jgi:carbamoyl-phosphate synthase large subunit
MLDRLGLNATQGGTATNEQEALAVAERVGYPVLVRPSFVLGGRAMEIVYTPEDLRRYIRTAVQASPERPVLVDRFLEDATEVDVDCLSDGTDTIIGGVMEHIEEAGVHSGDSACVIPSFSLSAEVLGELKSAAKAMARELKVRGLMNVQFAVKDEKVYVLEVNPRASRTIPYVSKAIGVPLAKLAAKVMAGHTLKELGVKDDVVPDHFAVKEAVFPFVKFPGVDTLLGPEMKSTGEVMGVGRTFGEAFVKSQLAAGVRLPESGSVFISVRNDDKPRAVKLAGALKALGFSLVATRGTAAAIAAAGLPVSEVNKVQEGRPHIVDMLKNGEIALVINTVEEKRGAVLDSRSIRTTALAQRVTYYTTIAGASAAVEGMRYLSRLDVYPLQELHRSL